MKHGLARICLFFLAVSLGGQLARAERLKELVSVEGFRDNQLVGYGIVIGLNGTGDNASSPIVQRSLANLLRRLGVRILPRDIQAKNVAAVIVTATLPPFARAGTRVDVTVSSVGEAKSLRGGTLIATPLKGGNGRTYAVAQGALSSGAFAVEGLSGSSKAKNHPTVARIPQGALIESNAPNALPTSDVVLVLNRPDFTTAARIANAIDAALNRKAAQVRDPGTVRVRMDKEQQARSVQFIAALEALEATPDAPAKVVIDERTGTVVVGGHVTLGQAAVAHGAITVTIDESQDVSQPGILGAGETVPVQETKIKVDQANGQLRALGPATTLSDVAAALNKLGAKPQDMISIFQALSASGALRAQVEVL